LSAQTLSLCIICHDRPDELDAALASAPGFDEVLVVDMASDPPLASKPGVRMIRLDQNRNVTGGRNLLVKHATGDVIVFLDDDAVFAEAIAASQIRARMDSPNAPDALAFKIVRSDGSVVSAEYPFRGLPRDLTPRRCAYFVGCGVAIRRDAYVEAGGFNEAYGYSTEEIDLAFSLARAGRRIDFAPEIAVEHRPSLHGRAPEPDVPALRLQNRLMLVRAHLPWPIAAVHAGAWITRTYREARHTGDTGPWRRAWRTGLRTPVTRRPLTYRTLRELHRCGGRVLW
jgi:GT2 family glycosyltransferase